MSRWGGLALCSPLHCYGFEASAAFLLLRGCCLQLGVGIQFVLPSLFACIAREQRFTLFRPSVQIAMRNSVHYSWESMLEGSNPSGRMMRTACEGGFEWAHAGRCWGCNRTWTMRSTEWELHDAQLSHRSDILSDKSEWQPV